MMRWILVGIVGAILLGGAYYHFFYPPHVLKRETQATLDHFSEMVATKYLEKIGLELKSLLADEAKVHLAVNFFAIIQANQRPAMEQDFTHDEFIRFIDNILYSLSDYGASARLREFNLSEDRKSAEIMFKMQGQGDGISYLGGMGVNVRFTTDGDCKAHAVFEAKKPRFDMVNCTMQLRTIPKPEEAAKLRDPAVLKELLQGQ